MSLTFDDVDFTTERLELPTSAPVVALPAPCLADRDRAVAALAPHLGFEARHTVDVPHGYLVGDGRGQVEVFAASGAVRGRSLERINAYADERRPWTDVTRNASDDGWALGSRSADRLVDTARRLLDRAGLASEPARIDVAAEQWARADESGEEVESGLGRATVRFGYAVAGLPLVGPGAKTNLHFDPVDRVAEGEVQDGALARFFHVHRGGGEVVGEVATLPPERVFASLLGDDWSGARTTSGRTRLVVTAARLGLLALPADRVQRSLAPVLVVSGELQGAQSRDGREAPIRFGRYLPLAEPSALADLGVGSATEITPGREVRARRPVLA